MHCHLCCCTHEVAGVVGENYNYNVVHLAMLVYESQRLGCMEDAEGKLQ